MAVAYADHTTEDKEERAFLGEDTAMTPDEVLQAKNQEENRRKSEYKSARLGAEVRLLAKLLALKVGSRSLHDAVDAAEATLLTRN